MTDWMIVLTVASTVYAIGSPLTVGYLRWKDAEWARLDAGSAEWESLKLPSQRAIDRAEDLHRYYTGQGHWGTASRDSHLRR